jgi:hypothetical protein
MVFCAELSRLIPTNPDYEATWGGAVFALVFGVFFSVRVLVEGNGEAGKDKG